MERNLFCLWNSLVQKIIVSSSNFYKCSQTLRVLGPFQNLLWRRNFVCNINLQRITLWPLQLWLTWHSCFLAEVLKVKTIDMLLVFFVEFFHLIFLKILWHVNTQNWTFYRVEMTTCQFAANLKPQKSSI